MIQPMSGFYLDFFFLVIFRSIYFFANIKKCEHFQYSPKALENLGNPETKGQLRITLIKQA